MKKLIFSVMILTFLLCNVSYGAVSEDIYVRKDVFSAEMKNINSKLDFIIEEMKLQRQEIQTINKKLNDFEKSIAVLSERIDRINTTLSERIDKIYATLSGKIDKINTTLSERIDKNDATLSEKIDGLNVALSTRIDGTDKRLDDFRNNVYLGLVLLGIFVAWPSIKDYFKWREEHKEAQKKFIRKY